MKLNSLHLRNFRKFESLQIDFHPRLTVIAAKNGQGKTAVLDAATVALGTFVGAFDMGRQKSFCASDVRLFRKGNALEQEPQTPVSVVAHLAYGEKSLEIKRQQNSRKGKTSVKDASLLTKLGKEMMENVSAGEPCDLPIMAYYGSGRLWNTHKNIQRKSVVTASRTMGYEDCFSSASNFKQLQQWMKKSAFALTQSSNTNEQESEKLAQLHQQIVGIEQAVDQVLESQGLHHFHYSFIEEDIVMKKSDEDLTLPIGMLSDGVRAMVSLVSDLAWRCSKLNPHMHRHAAQQTAGIVLIDEVDMHLHPKWQQTVIKTLQSAFPNVQFIVTTHSPQVLSTVKAESIRTIQAVEQASYGEIKSIGMTPNIQSKGVSSSYLLSSIQGVDSVPPEEEAHWLAEYRSLISHNEYSSDEGEKLKGYIINHFGAHHHEWLECERLIRMQERKVRLTNRKA